MSNARLSLPPDAPIVECVPNFSEGRDPAVIEAITAAISAVPGLALLDVDRGEATHRTVVTFVGSPEAVLEGAFRSIARAQALIDMRAHKGAHPRIGATDVCPFVPVRNIDMEACARLASRLAQRVGAELGIPVYLYERAASRPERSNLADIRTGEYEGLQGKLQDPEWRPDAGPSDWSESVARSGATVIGARPFLIAWNVNLATRNLKKANRIAHLVREKGIMRRDAQGQILRDAEGKALYDPGLYKHVKAIGWVIEEYDRAQISINFTDHNQSPVHEVIESIRRVAFDEGVVITGSELVGLIPEAAMLEAGAWYLSRQGLNPGAPKAELVEVAIRSLGLRDLGPFDPEQRIIERRLGGDGRLVNLSLRGFVDALSSSSPAPGGGSVAALCGALAAGLAAMVGQLTSGKKGYEALTADMDRMSAAAQGLKEGFLADIDADTAAFDAVMAAFGLPRATDADKAARQAAIQQATRGAIDVPMRVLERCAAAMDLIELAARGNANARSDAGVAGLAVGAAAQGAWYNVQINLKGYSDLEDGARLRARADRVLAQVLQRAEVVRSAVQAELCG